MMQIAVGPFRRNQCSPKRSPANELGSVLFSVSIAAAALFLVSISPATAADFPTVVANILNSQSDGRIAKLDPATKQEMVNCVNRVLAGLPNGKKKFVAEGASFDEQENRFGRVVKENRAEWEQKIAAGCGKIAMRGGKGIGHQ